MTTLTRLFFQIPAERLDEFAVLYERSLIPILAGHGLSESPEPGRPTAGGFFTRLF